MYLGSLKAACKLEEWPRRFGVRITVVLSMCLGDMSMKGAPPDWTADFGKHGVSHIGVSLEGVRSAPARNPADLEHRAIALFDACATACSRLHKLRQELAQAGEPCNVLMHCVGGINRSPAMLCTWLIVAHGMAAEAAVAQLLQARLSLRPWSGRDYTLRVLKMLESAQRCSGSHKSIGA